MPKSRTVALREEHVGRLEIPVEDPRRVGALHAARHLAQHVGDLGREQRAAALDPSLQALAFEHLHGDEGDRSLDAVIEDLHHVRALELRRRARLELEAREHRLPFVLPSRVDELHRHGGAERQVLGAPHFTHRPRADLRREPIPPPQHRPRVPRRDSAGRRRGVRGGGDVHGLSR